jgi:SAM-dependent methyltransferase
MLMQDNTREIYDAAADRWQRNQPLILSDFTARPALIAAAGDVTDLHLWDLGCGEGYVGRQLAKAHPARIDGYDLSKEMVDRARHQAGPLDSARGGPLHYAEADLSDPLQLPEGCCDAALAVFLFNYLTLEAMERVLRHAHAAIRPGGFFLFSVPHPALAFLRAKEPPFFFDPAHHSYLNSSDQLFEGRIWRRDGISTPVRCIHKTLSDYVTAIRAAGWQQLPTLQELGVSAEHLALDPSFFGPLEGLPLHLLVRLER